MTSGHNPRVAFPPIFWGEQTVRGIAYGNPGRWNIMPYSNSPRKSPRKHGSESLEKITEPRMTKQKWTNTSTLPPTQLGNLSVSVPKKVDGITTRRPQKVQRSVKVGMMGWYFEDGIRGDRITPFTAPFKGHEWKGKNPKLGDLLTLTMVINHLLNRMMLQGRRPW